MIEVILRFVVVVVVIEYNRDMLFKISIRNDTVECISYVRMP